MRTFHKQLYTRRLQNNYRLLQQKAGNALVLPVVKADGYGHGMFWTVETLRAIGVNFFAVAYSGEALALKQRFPECRVLMMGVAEAADITQLVAQHIDCGVSDAESLHRLDRAAGEQQCLAQVHLKIDTGMGRLGFRSDAPESLINACLATKNTVFAGLMSHLACADTPAHPMNDLQTARFTACAAALREAGIRCKQYHLANSGGTLYLPQSRFDMVRTGISLYGYAPGNSVPFAEAFQPVMEIHGTLSHVKKIKKGEPVSYGAGWQAPTDGCLAVIPLGYGDGLPRLLSNNNGNVLINGTKFPLRGRVCMDQCMVFDHTDQLRVGDPVCIIGEQGGAKITADTIAAETGTIPYEILCGFLPRLPSIVH